MAGSKHPSEKPDPALVERIERLYRGYQSLGYYGVLDVDKDASAREIKQAYHRLAKEFHPDRFVNVGSDSLKEKLNVVFSIINEAYRELTSPQNVLGSSSVPGEEVSRGEDNKNLAKKRFKEGKQLFSSGQYEQAVVLFGQAVYLDDSEPEYHYSHAKALLKIRKMKPAEESLRRAALLDPSNSKYNTELGYVYLELGFKARAKSAFEKALKCNPSDEGAMEGMKILA